MIGFFLTKCFYWNIWHKMAGQFRTGTLLLQSHAVALKNAVWHCLDETSKAFIARDHLWAAYVAPNRVYIIQNKWYMNRCLNYVRVCRVQ